MVVILKKEASEKQHLRNNSDTMIIKSICQFCFSLVNIHFEVNQKAPPFALNIANHRRGLKLNLPALSLDSK